MMDGKGIGGAARPTGVVAREDRFRRGDWRYAVGVVQERKRWTPRKHHAQDCPRAPSRFFLGRWAKCGIIVLLLAAMAGTAQYFGAAARLAQAADSIRKSLEPGERINEQIQTR